MFRFGHPVLVREPITRVARPDTTHKGVRIIETTPAADAPGPVDGIEGDADDAVRGNAGVLSDPGRLAALDQSQLLDSPAEETFDRLTRLAARILRAPVSLVTFVDDKRQFYKSALGVAQGRSDPLSHSYCQYVVRSGSPFVVEDARVHPLLNDSPAVEDNAAISYCGVPIADPNGYTLGSLCVVDTEPRTWTDDEVAALTDIAAAAVAEVRLRFFAKDLASTNGALRDMIATTSHDLRNPLSIIMGFAGFLRSDDDISPEERREFGDFIHEAARCANVLVGDLLQISKLDAGVVEPRTKTIHLATAVDSSRVQGGASAAEVFNNVPDDLEAAADPDHLHRMLTNLITNASKYGVSPISVSAEAVGERVLIHVTDEGAGVPPEFVPHLFEKFARSEQAKASRPEGTGLGLTIVAGLAQINGGSVWYERNEPTGARFIVELPSANVTAGP